MTPEEAYAFNLETMARRIAEGYDEEVERQNFELANSFWDFQKELSESHDVTKA